jgi:hypothetical protein
MSAVSTIFLLIKKSLIANSRHLPDWLEDKSENPALALFIQLVGPQILKPRLGQFRFSRLAKTFFFGTSFTPHFNVPAE